MKIGGNYNFGVWNPPTGIDDVKQSEFINLETANKYNNQQVGKEEGIKQNFGISLSSFDNLDANSVVELNNNNLKTFDDMTRQGWGGRFKTFTPVSNVPIAPVTTESENNRMPLNWQPSKPELPPFNIAPSKFYVRVSTTGTDGRYWYHDGNGTTNYSVTPPQTGRLLPTRYSPLTEPTICATVTQAEINASTWNVGSGVQYRPAGVDFAYYMARKINRIEVFSDSRYMSPFGLIIFERQTYYRRIRIIRDYGGSNGYKTGMIVNNPVDLVYWWNFPSNDGEGEFWEWMEWELISKTKYELIECGKPLFLPPYLGIAAPPPPKRKMNCCDCNTISSIIEAHLIAQLKPLGEQLKDHIDQRTKEEIEIHRQQLEALEVDLQPVIDRINETEKNLWNGIEIKQ